MRGVLVACTLALATLSGCVGDSAPSGFKRELAAAQVPSMGEAPRLDKQASPGEWDEAMLFKGVFSIRDRTLAEGDYPFEMRLGHDDRFLFALVAVHDVPVPNPFNGQPTPSSRHGFGLGMFLDTKLAERLETPEDHKHFVLIPDGPSHTGDGFWNGMEWERQPEGADPENKPWVNDRPQSGTWGRGWSSGTDLFWEINIALKPPSLEHDGFDPLALNGIFRLGLLFEVQGADSPDGRWPLVSPRDCFPGDGYTPNGIYDPASWMRLQLA